jgi:hypothetical protein
MSYRSLLFVFRLVQRRKVMYWDVGLLRICPLPSGEFELAKEPVGFFVLHVDVLVGWSGMQVDVI